MSDKERLEQIKFNNKHTYCDKTDVDFLLNLIEKQQDIINRIEKYAKGVDDKELLLIVKASNQINDLFYKCKKGGLLDE